jgi:hypothetical protein
MKTKSILSIAIIILIVSQIFSSCKKEEDDNISQNTFTFMKTGTKWTYNTFDSSDPSIIIEEVYEITEMGTDGWAKLKWSIAGYLMSNVEWYADNTQFCNLGQKNSNKKLILTTANPAVNDTWSETWTTNTGTVTNTHKVTDLNQSVTVPAGTFNCIKIRETTSDDNVYYKDYWFNIQKGVIKTEATTAADYPNILYSELKTIQIP